MATKKVFDKSKLVGEMDKRRSERLPDFICKIEMGKRIKVGLLFCVLLSWLGQLRTSLVPFLSLEFLGLVFAKSAFAVLPILRVLPQLGTANQRTQPSIFFDRVTLGMRGLVFTTEGINRN